jgi:hypothetical protein
MTREEAVKYIKSRCIGSASKRDGTKWSDAMWTAIEALSADRLTGEWNPYYTKREHNHIFNCKLCGDTFIVTQGNDDMNYCPNCGTRMEVHNE